MTEDIDELEFLGRAIGRNPEVYYWEAGSNLSTSCSASGAGRLARGGLA